MLATDKQRSYCVAIHDQTTKGGLDNDLNAHSGSLQQRNHFDIANDPQVLPTPIGVCLLRFSG